MRSYRIYANFREFKRCQNVKKMCILESMPNGDYSFSFFLFYSFFALSLKFPSVIDFTESLWSVGFAFGG